MLYIDPWKKADQCAHHPENSKQCPEWAEFKISETTSGPGHGFQTLGYFCSQHMTMYAVSSNLNKRPDPCTINEDLGINSLGHLEWTFENLLGAIKQDLDGLVANPNSTDHEDSGRRIVEAFTYYAMKAILSQKVSAGQIQSDLARLFEVRQDLPRLSSLTPLQRLSARLEALCDDLRAFDSAYQRHLEGKEK